MNVLRLLEKQSKLCLLTLGFVLTAVVGVEDYLTGSELSISIFYLVPVALTTWSVGRWAGSVTSVLSACTWFLADFFTLPSYSHPAIPYWNATIVLGFFLIVSFVLSALKKSLERENRLARKIQGDLLPKEIPHVPGYEISVSWHASSVVTGDYLDVLTLGDRKVGFCIADVAGHGIPAAILMSNLQAAVKIFALNNWLSPAELCGQLNQLIGSNVTPGMFITLFYGVLDTESKRLTYSSAGHNPAIIVRRDGSTQMLTQAGPPLGVLRDFSYQQGEFELASGDEVLLFTDGVIEATNGEKQTFDEESLVELLKKNHGLGAVALQKSVMEAVRKFSGGNFEDDVTLIALSVE